jgi:acyl-CoA oxidase
MNGRISRERTGGAGFLMVNHKQTIFSAHSASTAEGDNKVLMQKVVKDILADTRQKRHDNVKYSKERVMTFKNQQALATDFEILRDLIYYRESFEIKSISKILQKKVFEEEQKFFDVWMSSVNDDIQNLAEAFGERYFLQAAWAKYEQAAIGSSVKNLLRQILKMHMIFYLQTNLGWYLTNDIISIDGAKNINDAFPKTVKEFVPHVNSCLEAFNFIAPDANLPQMARDEYWKYAGRVAPDSDSKPFDFTKPVQRPRL